MKSRCYSVGELRRCIKESNEFKPTIGNGVVKSDTKNNKEAYKSIKKETDAYNKVASTPNTRTGKSELAQTNMGMSDLEYDGSSKEFNNNVKSQIKGYDNAQNEKLHKNDIHTAEYNDAIEKENAKSAKEKRREKNVDSEVGLTSSKKNKEDVHMHGKTYSESKKISALKFKHIQFISESHMLNQVPDEYKVEGRRFYMKDCKGNNYLVEWGEKPHVEECLNENKAQSEIDRIKNLFGYQRKETSTTPTLRINEESSVNNMLDKIRGLL